MRKDDLKKDPFEEPWYAQYFGGGSSWGGRVRPAQPPEPVYIEKDYWPAPKPRTDLIFAKSCIDANWCQTDAGTSTEPASNFGEVMVAGAMAIPVTNAAVATKVGAELALGRVTGGGIMQRGLTWAIRGASLPASVFILGMLPTKMGDGTLYTDEQLRNMTRAPTRVRFQFRQDAEGVLQVYGIHTGPTGDDSVRTVQAAWNADQTALEAKLNGITILWTPKRGPLGEMPPLIYPENSGEQLGTILVHPIPENTDSQIEGFPGEDITTDDCIVVFPADTGLKSMYVVFARPVGGDHSYHSAPKRLKGFPDAMPVKKKSSVQGGGKKRSRWKDRKGRIYEWDYENGRVEIYDRQGKHLGEFDPDTGERTKDAEAGRTTPK
ncbi:S-type pyocin domain-containing protein [Pseudomonas caspiana]|uniref:S-type pyocin domain-containing protein n=1 Tax=Pseudomonas caspiana TaxID=1451454 RepID=UPI0032EC74E5